MSNKIFVIEDDNYINDMLRKLLSSNGYDVICAYSGTEALLLHNKDVDLILLDLMLPGKNGEDIIKSLKKINDIPVIVMSAICDIDKKLDLFELGAVDYITKPFDNKELIARIKVHLKNKNVSDDKNNILEYKDIKLDVSNYSAICNGKNISFTKHEFLLLKTLIERPNQVHTKSVLFDTVWSDENSADDNTLNVHISKIRSKLKKCNENEDYIETVWSIGYRMKK